ncbi:MAG TPA: hypothetical protein VJH65_02075 [Candidatus Nanoarchaeia archaeon]|nr:hypothetical protein [Candidatus Nanoarchaeia archaeon]
MKNKTLLINLLSLLIFILILNLASFVSGLVILNDLSSAATNTSTILNATREDALKELDNSLLIIPEMENNNFSTVYMLDLMTEAENVLEQVDYAMILRDPSLSEANKTDARKFLRFVDWKNLSYSNVLFYTNEIKNRKERAFVIYDNLISLGLRFERLEKKGLDLADCRNLLDSATVSFHEDRYDESEGFLINAEKCLEEKNLELARLGAFAKGTKTFIRDNWAYFLLFLIFISAIGFFSARKISKKLIERKIKKLKLEQSVLINLIKEAQYKRFKTKEIPEIIYNIRMNKYNNRIDEIKSILPVLEPKLMAMNKKFKK